MSWDYIVFTIVILVIVLSLVICLCTADHFNGQHKKRVRFQMDEENSSAMSSTDLLASAM